VQQEVAVLSIKAPRIRGTQASKEREWGGAPCQATIGSGECRELPQRSLDREQILARSKLGKRI